MTTTALFSAADLTQWVGESVDDDRAAMVEKVVWGWLRPVLGLQARPDDVSPELFSWAVELGGIAFENPSGLEAYQLGDERSQYSSERRDEILREAAAGGTSASGVPRPRGSFPAPCGYPDPATTRYGYGYGYGYNPFG